MKPQKHWSKYSAAATWICLTCLSLPVLANPSEYAILSNFKERPDKGLNNAEFISGNGISNSIASAPPFSGGGSGNIQATSGIMMNDDRIMFETYTMANINISYADASDGIVRLTWENNGKFGEGRVFPVSGRLVHVTSAKDINDHSACHPKIRGTGGQRLPSEPWVALIRRGVCKFEDKVKHVYYENAVGVIVYNDRDSQNLDKMQIADKDRNITAVFTYKSIGDQLASLLEKGLDVTANITPGETITKQYQNMNRTSVLFVSISFIILMIISLVWLVFYYVQRFRYLQSKDKQSRRMCNVAKRIIAKIPLKSVRTEDKELQNECCPICIEQYRVADVIRVLPCKHEFHKNCIDPWLLDHRLCPMCKIDVLKYYGFVFTGSQESILQMDLDVGEGDIEEEDADTTTNNHSRGISPMPQIRSDRRMMSRSSSLNSDVDIQIVTEATPSLQWAARDCDEPVAVDQGQLRPGQGREDVQPYSDEAPEEDNYHPPQSSTCQHEEVSPASGSGSGSSRGGAGGNVPHQSFV